MRSFLSGGSGINARPGDAVVRRLAYQQEAELEQTLQINYDNEAHASYIYFTGIGPGGIAETVPFQRMDVDLDENDQVAVIRVFESENCKFQHRLKYALRYPEVSYHQAEQ